MNAEELMKKIIVSYSDEDGIQDRFGTNAELYEQCFLDFMSEPNFSALDDAIAARDYRKAFEAAHALKGVSGNLGLTAFYNSICVLVESLRNENYSDISTEYADVLQQFDRLRNEFSEETPQGADINTEFPCAKADSPVRKSNRLHILIYVLFVFAVIVFVVFFIFRININYQNNVLIENGQHLAKTGNQIRLYVEEHIVYDWRMAESVGESIVGGCKDEQSLVKLLERKQAVWGVTDFMVYTENGHSVNSDGLTDANNAAADTVAEAAKSGKTLSVANSSLIYTIPIDTELCYNGSKIIALSVVHDMSAFLDEMNFSYYDTGTMLYLTMDNGVIISRLTNEGTYSELNFKSITEDKKTRVLDGSAAETDMFSSESACAYLMSDGEENFYVVSAPVETGSIPLRIFYLEPENSVNSSMNTFSDQLIRFSIVIMVLFAGLAFVTFLNMYISRKRSFDKAMYARDRMLDLMIINTKTAFALFSTERDKPDYCSSNAVDIIGDTFWTITHTDSGYKIRSNTGIATRTVEQANEMLSGWDGKTSFSSGYIRYGQTINPNYFVYQLYPVDEDGKEFIGIAQDVTAVYEREEVIKNAMDMAKRSNEAKSRFLSHMSHDIRTPMNAIVNMTNFSLENIDNPKKLAVYLHTIRESSEHLLHLINDVLDMSRIESGQTVVISAPFDIKAEIMKQADMIKPLCAEKKLTLLVNTEGIKTNALLGDSLKLAQIVMNLLSNAVKFTPERGAVRLSVNEIPSIYDDMTDIRIKVEDTGIGISEENLAHIFEPFCRADDKRINRIEGTGLGLSICKSYAEAMGGSIRCESEEGEGTTFTVELFFHKADSVQRDVFTDVSSDRTRFIGMHCLVVEDNAINRMIAKELLEQLGFIVDFADNGSEGVARFLETDEDTYDVIYMDVQMPVMDGYQAAREIRASGHPRAKQIPIIAMTANAFSEDIEKALTAGMDAYVGKPIVITELTEQTGKIINEKKEMRI